MRFLEIHPRSRSQRCIKGTRKRHCPPSSATSKRRQAPAQSLINRFETRQQAIAQITEYIELFYNRQRLQARLGYLSPATFEQHFYPSQPGKT